MSKDRDRLQENPRPSRSTPQRQDNLQRRQSEGRQNAQLGDRGASAASAGERRQQGQGRRGGNRKPESQR